MFHEIVEVIVILDIFVARQLQFALGSGACGGETTVQVMYGKTTLEDLPATPRRYRSHGPVVSAYIAEDGSGEGQEPHTVLVEESEGSGQPSVGVESISSRLIQSDQPPASYSLLGEQCTSWEVVHTYTSVPHLPLWQPLAPYIKTFIVTIK